MPDPIIKPDETSASGPRRSRPPLNTWTVFLLLILVLVLGLWIMNYFQTRASIISYDFFRKQLGRPDAEGKPTKTNIEMVEFRGQQLVGEFVAPPPRPDAPPDFKTKQPPHLAKKFVVGIPPSALMTSDLEQTLLAQGVKIQAEEPADSSGWMVILSIVTMLLVFGAMFLIYRRTQSQLMGGGFLGSFIKSGAKRYERDRSDRVTFKDVAGLDTVKGDLTELVEFLKNPKHFQRLGARIPKGTLLIGPPGTGKTLLARAVAGEAGVPFFSINGSEFIQMFVGVGASRVRDLFQTAREHSPCILFIDEIDAVGRVRGAGLGGGHDEREQTLNQILSEMDGFTKDEAVIVLAATNRPDVLDPALLRPGRFDRHITVDRPNLKARQELFHVHTREVKLAPDISFELLARGTIGLTGADIRNIVNEAALWATRQGKECVDMQDFEHARDKVLMGAKRDEVLNPLERRRTAYHECGHALVAWLLPGADPVHKVTIIPRGLALGVTQILPEEERLSMSESRIRAMLAFILGGRAAEKVVFNEYFSGAESDLKKATSAARRMVTAMGMSERLGPVNYQTSEEHPFLGKEFHEMRQFSEHTAQLIDEEVARILNDAFETAVKLLEKHRTKLDQLVASLEDREVLDAEEIEALIGPSPNKQVSANGQPHA